MKTDQLIDQVIIGLANLNDLVGQQVMYETHTKHNENRLRSVSAALKKASRDAAKIRNARSVVEQICERMRTADAQSFRDSLPSNGDAA